MTQLEVVQRDMSLARINADDHFVGLLDSALGQPRMVWLVLLAVREYHTVAQLRTGRGYGAPGLRQLINRQPFDRQAKTQAERIVRALDGLYSAHDEGQVRGAVLERLAEQQIRSRYAGLGAMCENNIKFRVWGSKGDHTTSRSVDVVGWDGTTGECHDCKVDARKFDAVLVAELERDVTPHGLVVGMVTADQRPTAERKLRALNFRRATATALVTEETLFSVLPLRP